MLPPPLGFRAQGFWVLRIQGSGSGLGLDGLGFRVQGFGGLIWGVGLRVEGLGYRVQSKELKV